MYSSYAGAYAEAIKANIYNAHFERPSLLSLLPDVQGASVLDLGCGPGVYAQVLTEKGATVTAIDGSAEMVAMVKDSLGEKVRCYAQDLKLGLPDENDNAYDLIICPLAIHYLKDWTVLLKDIRRVFKKDGVFVFSTHHPMVDFNSSLSGNYFQTELVEEQWNTIGKPVEVAFYRRSLTSIFEAIKNAGLVVTDFNEGTPLPELELSNPEKFAELKTKPCFLFFRCEIRT